MLVPTPFVFRLLKEWVPRSWNVPKNLMLNEGKAWSPGPGRGGTRISQEALLHSSDDLSEDFLGQTKQETMMGPWIPGLHLNQDCWAVGSYLILNLMLEHQRHQGKSHWASLFLFSIWLQSLNPPLLLFNSTFLCNWHAEDGWLSLAE